MPRRRPADAAQHVDAVLISHMHLDHLDLPSLRSLDGSFRLLVPRGAGQFLRRKGFAGRADRVVMRVTHSVYFARDTDLFDGMDRLGPDLDVALLPVWGWGPTLGRGHLDPERAARAAQLLQPRLAVPIHWGTFFPRGRRKRDRLTAPPREFAKRVADLAPDVNVRVVEPGGSLALTG